MKNPKEHYSSDEPKCNNRLTSLQRHRNDWQNLFIKNVIDLTRAKELKVANPAMRLKQHDPMGNQIGEKSIDEHIRDLKTSVRVAWEYLDTIDDLMAKEVKDEFYKELDGIEPFVKEKESGIIKIGDINLPIKPAQNS